MRIDATRLIEQLETLGNIGFEAEKGTSRPAYSQAFNQGRAYVQDLMTEAGLITSVDEVGNLVGVLGGKSGYKKISIGSHIDTVPWGGIYDGTLGVLAAIEVIRALKNEEYENKHPIEIIAFNEEEGNVIGGTFGSKAFVGAKLEDAMRAKMAEHQITLQNYRNSKRRAEDYHCYVELHIEQGGRLEKDKTDIGLVEGIVGIVRYKASVTGQANHAGSTPMDLRDDALTKTCEIIDDLMKTVVANSRTMVCTVGTLNVVPGVVNIIPGLTEFVIEMRDSQMESMEEVIAGLRDRWESQGLELEKIIDQPVTRCDKHLGQLLEDATESLGLSAQKIFSGAGHDLINMAMLTPSVLIFIPSKDGISHSIKEFSEKRDIANGTEVLLELVKKIDEED